MKTLTEWQALLASVGISTATLAATLGLALGIHEVESKWRNSSLGKVSAESSLTGGAAQGRHLFLMNCAHCHGDDATGDEGPDLHDLRRSDKSIHDLITLGKKGEMPSFGKKLNDADIQALTAYLRTLRS